MKAFGNLRAKAQASIDDATSLTKNSVSSILGSKSEPKGPTEEEIALKKARLAIPKRDTDRPLRILSLDGGGVRGYSALIILRDFLANLQQDEGLDEPILPADYFDLIIGTSTGGILALMLGRLRMTVEECLEAYRTLAREVFSGGLISTTFNATTTMLFEGGRLTLYDESTLEKSVKATVKKWTADDNEDALLFDPSPDSCRTAIVTALSADATRPVLMRSYPGDPKLKGIKIWEAARATSAAPVFFRPLIAGPEEISYIDGAVSGNSNPSLLALEEIEKLWPKERKIGLFLSLGTGSPNQVALQGQVTQLAFALANLTTNTIHVHEKAVLWFTQHFTDKSQNPYERFTVESSIQGVRMDDHSSLPKIAEETTVYLRKEVEKMKRLVELARGTMKSLKKGKEAEAKNPEQADPVPPYEAQTTH
ncbi:Patatin-like phospholipase [Ceratobasidium theobromae]|uniref:Patatin-like phospholipase n=1 Tax=Ceratobasidium theobromae TaxID=1582974 RepID=A0A5N5QCR5_9AGAM|nr:Patatin-like phospholipase [Ceratobasidium theobromae]